MISCTLSSNFGDIFYILSTGKYIAETKTIPQLNPFTQDSTRKIVIQNWLSCLWDYFLYSKIGEYAFFIFVLLMSAVACFVLYKYISLYTSNRVRKVSIMVFCVISITQLFTARAGLLTFIVLVLEQIILKKYHDGRQQNLVWILPLFSVFLVNHQASYWLFLFVFAMPYFTPWLSGLTYRSLKQSFCKSKKLLLSLAISFFAGFINPYGTKSMFYLLYSYGSAANGDIIDELTSPRLWTIHAWLVISVLIVFVYVRKTHGRGQIPSHVMYLTFGICILAMLAIKNCWLLPICAVPLLAQIPGNIGIGNNRETAENKKYILGIGVLAVYLVANIASGKLTTFVPILEADTYVMPRKAVEYLDQYNKDDIKVYSHTVQNNFLEWNGYKVYMDSRPEVYNKKLSGGEDLYANEVCIIQGGMNYAEFLEENQFTHVLTYLSDGTEQLNCLDAYMQNCDEYELVLESENGYKLYELKTFSHD